MGRWLVKVDEDRFLEWSSIVDAPVTMIMSREQLRAFVRERHGTEGLERLEDRIARAQPLSKVGWNRAGPKETCLTPEQIVELYTVPTQRQGDGT